MKAEAQKKKARARRQRIPAFGEWNYAYVVGAGDDWPPVTQCFDSAMQAAGRRLVVPIPPSPPPKPANKVVKWRESATPTLELDDEKEKQRRRQHVVVGLGEGGDHGGGAVKMQGKQQQSRVVVHAYEAAVKAIDQDLYHIPPDMLCHEPRKRLMRRRTLWMGCLGLDCVA